MVKRITFSGDQKPLSSIARYHSDLEAALRDYYSPLTPKSEKRFVGYSSDDLRRELLERIAELELSSSFTILASVEASFQTDYLQRCQQRRRDAISRRFRGIYAHKASHVSLDEDIFEVWLESGSDAKVIIGTLRGAFKFRHWLAHGRYWLPKELGRRYDYQTIYEIADAALRHFHLVA